MRGFVLRLCKWVNEDTEERWGDVAHWTTPSEDGLSRLVMSLKVRNMNSPRDIWTILGVFGEDATKLCSTSSLLTLS